MMLQHTLGAGQCKSGCWDEKARTFGLGFRCSLGYTAVGQVCCEVASNLIVVGPAAPQKSGQPLWCSGPCVM